MPPSPKKNKNWMIFLKTYLKHILENFSYKNKLENCITLHPILYQIFYPSSKQNLDDG